MSKDDFDSLDNDVIGNKLSIKEKLDEIKVEKEDDPYQNLLDLTDNCKKVWISIPRNNGMEVEVFDVSNCPHDKFFEWLNYIWPMAKTMKHTAEDYKKEEARQNAVLNVFYLHQKLKFKSESVKQ